MNKQMSENPNVIINDMMGAIDVLRDLYVRETEALDNANINLFMRLQPEKSEYAHAYKERISYILSRKEEMRNADPSLKQKLHDMQAEFSQLTSKNLKALQRMQRCTERLGKKIELATRETARKKGTLSYGETGALNTYAHKKPISIGVQETA